MDKETADKIAKLIGYADNGCSSCVEDLAEKAEILFPGWTFTVTGRDVEEFIDDWHKKHDLSISRVGVEASSTVDH